MWYYLRHGFLRDKRRRKIQDYTMRIQMLTEYIEAEEAWSYSAGKLEEQRADVFFKRQRLIERETTV